MAERKPKKCPNCHYQGWASVSQALRVCRYYPPRGKMFTDRHNEWYSSGYWPRVDEDDWCGNYLEKADVPKVT